MKRQLVTCMALAVITHAAAASAQTATFTFTIPYTESFIQPYEHKPTNTKPEWKLFLQKYGVSTIAALAIGAITGIGSGQVEKHWVTQNHTKSEFRYLVNFFGSMIARISLVNLINNVLEENDIPHESNLISLGSWLASWGFYIYSIK